MITFKMFFLQGFCFNNTGKLKKKKNVCNLQNIQGFNGNGDNCKLPLFHYIHPLKGQFNTEAGVVVKIASLDDCLCI